MKSFKIFKNSENHGHLENQFFTLVKFLGPAVFKINQIWTCQILEKNTGQLLIFLPFLPYKMVGAENNS